MRASVVAIVVAIVVVVSMSVARAESSRSVAVVEFRAGSGAAPDIGAKLARLLTLKTGLAVMTPAAARQEIGPSLDAKVKNCSNNAPCLASLGRKLGVDEIILVGLSELGDVILTMQRVVVASESIAGTMAETISASTPLSEEQLEGYLRQVLPAKDFEQWGRIQIETTVSDASVVIDGSKRGATPLDPVTVIAPKSYEIEVAKSGFSKFRATIAVTPNALVVVRPQLSAVPRDAWYKKWWVLAIAGGVTAAAVTSAIVLSRDGAMDVPVVIEPF